MGCASSKSNSARATSVERLRRRAERRRRSVCTDDTVDAGGHEPAPPGERTAAAIIATATASRPSAADLVDAMLSPPLGTNGPTPSLGFRDEHRRASTAGSSGSRTTSVSSTSWRYNASDNEDTNTLDPGKNEIFPGVPTEKFPPVHQLSGSTVQPTFGDRDESARVVLAATKNIVNNATEDEQQQQGWGNSDSSEGRSAAMFVRNPLQFTSIESIVEHRLITEREQASSATRGRRRNTSNNNSTSNSATAEPHQVCHMSFGNDDDLEQQLAAATEEEVFYVIPQPDDSVVTVPAAAVSSLSGSGVEGNRSSSLPPPWAAV